MSILDTFFTATSTLGAIAIVVILGVIFAYGFMMAFGIDPNE